MGLGNLGDLLDRKHNVLSEMKLLCGGLSDLTNVLSGMLGKIANSLERHLCRDGAFNFAFHLIAFAWYYDVQIAWLAKQQIFRPPFGAFFRALGGIPVIRERRTNMVDAMAKTVVDLEVTGDRPLGMVIPVEGTRRWSPHWKSGFYHISRKSGVPIVLSYLDYARGVGGFGPSIHPTGDLSDDMDRIREFYEGRQGRFPELFGPVRLAEEDTEEGA